MSEVNIRKIIYKLTIEDIQNVAVEEIGRKLTTEEVKTLIDPIAGRIPWYDAIAYSINEYVADGKLII